MMLAKSLLNLNIHILLMKRDFLLAIFLAFVLFAIGFGFDKITGQAISNDEHTIGPSIEEKNCMVGCVSKGCDAGDMDCKKKNSEACLAECSIQKPEVTEETSCMEACVKVGCGEIDFSCQTINKDKCEKECNMIKEPEAKSEDEQCIRDCVNKVEPGLICRPGEGGEKGGDACQRCAKECMHLYAGPCLNEEKLGAKKKECETCEHCYGELIMGNSSEGYQCIVDVECKDATAMFGDYPGTGEGISLTEASADSGIDSRVSERISNIFESIGNFFSEIFGGEGRAEMPTETS